MKNLLARYLGRGISYALGVAVESLRVRLRDDELEEVRSEAEAEVRALRAELEEERRLREPYPLFIYILTRVYHPLCCTLSRAAGANLFWGP